ncbi:electron transfer flavoprotein-ubiquinone oxidoreductase [Pseudohongiella sp.]|uniref:electron-transferring-flavoprotein dehydrogenase n=1 Tax=marine sediment metagenome TaxID=412755 RepID=A0A0F9WGA7_9ZZZZ|nr:electron transfer flavoprotein-ubiquinone oxidoreductase [Pseudohongiella sp.]HDZ09280.1 electron transfer flavoprotein-ubiquinone oxidoreductase [Pseudohongiella sp.]HEA62144.1 electron transfer flavoprotein-ubiquinone oxidoreductase [Pseudohongiella sp.]
MQRESMEVDVVIVGAGPAGLATACRLLQLAQEAEKEISVCVLEKGSEVGAHILSGAVFEPSALNELFPDWKEKGAPLHTAVTGDDVYYLPGDEKSVRFPDMLVPKPMRNHGNYIISLGNLCRWLAEQAMELGAEVFPGFAAAEILYHEDGTVKGVATGDMGVDAKGEKKDAYEPGFEFHAKYTILAEGCRGHLGKELISRFELDKDSDPQHYGIGLKEVWEIPPELHKEGLVVHTAGYPMIGASYAGSSGGFLYHAENNQVYLGLIVDLGYKNPHISPFDEFQKFKQHPVIRQYIEGGKRLSYGARALNKGGLNSLPKMSFPGGLMIGCDAGTLNAAKIKGSHTAMRSGMLAAESLFESLQQEAVKPGTDLIEYGDRVKSSALYDELHKTRNFSAGFHKFGFWIGSSLSFIEHNIFAGRFPLTFHDKSHDYAQLKPAADCPKIDYPKPDGKITFDKLSSVFLSNTNHAEDQPCHLQLVDPDIPIQHNLPVYDEPAQRYCPAGVYEVLDDGDGGKRFQINAQNCVHCKTCDIKDPAQNIEWVVPEGSGGPNYPNM